MTDTTTLERATDATETPAADDGPMLVYLDPREVTAHPHNVRDSIDVSDILPSVREVGVLQPPLVASTGDGGWKIIAGHRRMAAAVEAGIDRVACLLREDLAGDTEAVIGMMVENLDRRDLTPIEEARGYQLLLDLGVPKTKIAKRTGRKPTHVKKALAIVDNPAATEAVEAGLTFEQALVIREFEEDPEAVEALYDAAQDGDGGFKHHASHLRERRKEDQQRAEAIEALAATGVTVIDPNDRDTWPNLTLLSSLVTDDDDANDIDPEAHANCPGHAAALDNWDNARVIHYCTDPAANGHRKRYASTFDGQRRGGGPMTDEEKAERQLVIDNNRAWKAAEPVRREWVRALLGRKKPPKGLLRWAVSEIMREPSYVGDASDGLLADLLGVDATRGTYGRDVGANQAARSTEAALPLVLFAQIAADREHHMDASTQPGKMTWRSPRAAEARYLVQLRDMGYTLSDVEQLAVDLVYPPDTGEADEASQAEDQPQADGGDDDPGDMAPVVALPTANGNDGQDDDGWAPLSVAPDPDSDHPSADVTPLAVVADPDGTDDTPGEDSAEAPDDQGDDSAGDIA